MACSWLCWLKCIPRTHCSELAATELWGFSILLPSWSLQYLKGIPSHLTCICNEYIAEHIRGTEHAKMLAFKHLPIHCCCCCLVTQSYLTLCDPMDCSHPPPGSSVHGILQARILEWVAISFSRGSSLPRARTHVSCIDKKILYLWETRECLNTCRINSWVWDSL